MRATTLASGTWRVDGRTDADGVEIGRDGAVEPLEAVRRVADERSRRLADAA